MPSRPSRRRFLDKTLCLIEHKCPYSEFTVYTLRYVCMFNFFCATLSIKITERHITNRRKHVLCSFIRKNV